MSSESFFARWSERKRAAQQAGPTAPDGEAPPVAPVDGTEAPRDISPAGDPQEAELKEAELTAEEIAALPSVEDLTTETDLSVFLRKGVPEPLRKAALRRMWTLDPAIRDFVGDARDYAYDWNVPGGVPGSGPLPTTEEVLRFAARIVSGEPTDERASDEPTPASDPEAQSGPLAEPASQNREGAAPPDVSPSAAPAPQAERPPARRPPAGDGAHGTASPAAAPAAAQEGAPLRRHGGAMPL